MYSEKHYRTRATLAAELAELPENSAQKSDYLSLARSWKYLADRAANGAKGLAAVLE